MKKFYLETYGCKLNQADSDLIRGILSKDFKEVPSADEADFIVINSCGVVEKTERKIFKRIKSFKRKKVILTGCLAQISPKKAREAAFGVLGPKDLKFVSLVAKDVLKGKKVFRVSNKRVDKARCFKLKKRKGTVSAIVSISEGCLGQCTYCATRYARGRLKSFEIEYILKEIEHLLSLGFKEIQLTSQDAVLYGLDKGKLLLPKLLKEICELEGDFRVRVGMMNPKFAHQILKELIEAFKSKKIYKFLHIPLQSGSNEVLKRMKRGYTVEDYFEIAREFKKNFKDLLLATDIIVGYPEETEEDFEETLRVIRKTKPSIIHVFRFSKRRGTEAFSLKDFPDRIKKQRSRKLVQLSKGINLKKNKKFLGKKFKVLITEKRKDTLIARLPSFRAVILKEGKIGSFEKIRVEGFKENYLTGTIIH